MRNEGRRLLPLLTQPLTGGRQSMTCKYRCADQCSQPTPNTSDNAYFGDVVAEGASRRQVLAAGGLGLAAAVATANAKMPSAQAANVQAEGAKVLGFEGIAPTPADVDELRVPKGFEWNTTAAWGDPIRKGGPAFDFNAQSEAAQKEQVGYNADFVTVIPTGENTAILGFNNEYVNPELMWQSVADGEDLTDEQIRTTMAAHGLTVLGLKRKDADSFYEHDLTSPVNRRIDMHTEFAIDGPAAGHDLLKTSADKTGKLALGTNNNCAGGLTPWGTILSGEENWHGYFAAADAPAEMAEEIERYGMGDEGRFLWEKVEDRFSMAAEPNEAHRFGYIVEIDPSDPNSTPVKHTNLGRFKHEGGNTIIADSGHAVVYMGDDERYDYMYKFVSRKKYVEGNKKHNMKLLEDGDLYVAKFTGDGMEDGVCDGTGTWIPLVKNGKSMVDGMSVEEVLVFTRMAADKVGPTKMDRPEDVEPNPVNGRIYAALTNNDKRSPSEIDEANPRPENKHGHVIEITEAGGDHTAEEFQWMLVLIAGDPNDPTTYFAGYDKSQVAPISCPDNVAFDSKGNLWIATDGMPDGLGHCDGLYIMPVEGEDRGKLQQFLSVPAAAECCGPWIGADGTSVFVAVQHPGEADGASPANPVSVFPYDEHGQPRPAVVEVKRSEGGPIIDTGVAGGSAFGNAQTQIGSLLG
ncbi:PhoX family protein [Kytococcus sp. Marseille-QA3725]